MKKALCLLFILIATSLLSSAYPYNFPVGIAYHSQLQSYLVTNQTEYGESGGCVSTVQDYLIFLLKPGAQPVAYEMGSKMTGVVVINDSVYFTDGCTLKMKYGTSKPGNFAQNPYTQEQDKLNFRAICYDGNRNIFISTKFEIYRLNLDTKIYKIFKFETTLNNPYGITWDNTRQRLIIVSNIPNSPIQALNPADSTITTLKTTSLPLACGITQDGEGNFLVSDWGDSWVGGGKIFKFDKDFNNAPVEIASGLSQPALIFYNPLSDTIAIPNRKNNTVTFMSAGPPVPQVFYVGDDNKPVSSTPTFRWKTTGADSYQLQVALSTSITNKDTDPTPLADDFANSVIDESNIKDTFYLSTKTLEIDKKYVWRVRSNKGTKYSPWSRILSFTPGKITDVTIEPISEEITFYPNPASNFIKVEGLEGQKVQIVSIEGIVLMESFSNEIIDIAQIPVGLYFIKKGNIISKFVKI